MKTLMRITIVLLVLISQCGPANGQTLATLYQFGGVAGDGQLPAAALVQGSDGNFYGTTVEGGTNSVGTVFRISAAGSLSTLYQFGALPTDGTYPSGGLVQGSDGNFYGTTLSGGTNGDGTVFRISAAGSLTTLYQFGALPTDGAGLQAGLVQGSDGFFYGTTQQGGTNGIGTVFRISPAGSFQTLYTFDHIPPGGFDPFAGLVQGSDGNLYGATFFGGTNQYVPNQNSYLGGAMYRISPTGAYSTVCSFGATANSGSNPQGGLVQGSDGNFYGMTTQGGLTNDGGVVFQASAAGALTTLYVFGGLPTDGRDPVAALVQGCDGWFYGTTPGGGTNGDGTVFRINAAGSLTTLYQFTGNATNGTSPYAALLQGSDGAFYGTTQYGGTNGGGTVFQFTVPLSPAPWPINQITTLQLAGTNIVLNVPSVAGETYQLQFSSSLDPAAWSNVPGACVSNSIGAAMAVTNFGAASLPQGYFRFQITP